MNQYVPQDKVSSGSFSDEQSLHLPTSPAESMPPTVCKDLVESLSSQGNSGRKSENGFYIPNRNALIRMVCKSVFTSDCSLSLYEDTAFFREQFKRLCAELVHSRLDSGLF
jgi:hypothetical protein